MASQNVVQNGPLQRRTSVLRADLTDYNAASNLAFNDYVRASF